MYCYVLDPAYIQKHKLEKTVNEIEQQLVSLDIAGPIIKIQQFNSLSRSLSNKIREGARTCIAIGDDHLLYQLINSIDQNHITIGYIPLEKNAKIPSKFRIPIGIDACFTISQRYIQTKTLGVINHVYTFFDYLHFRAKNISIQCDELFSITLHKDSEIMIHMNTNPFGLYQIVIQTSEQAFFQKNNNSPSVFQAQNILIHALDGTIEFINPPYTGIKSPMSIHSLQKKFAFIVGKQEIPK